MLLCASAITIASTRAHAEPPPERGPYVRLTVPMAPGLPELQRREGGSWSTVCEPPCRLTLDPHYEYRVGGRGVVDSDSFRLPPIDRVKVEANIGSSILRDLGTGFAVFGFVFAGVGGAVLLMPNDAQNSATAKAVVGWTFLGFGLLTTIFGVWLRQTNETRVTLAPLTNDGRP
jgi:hypothetical protein